MINKEKIKKEYVAALKSDLEKAQIGYKTAKNDTIEAEGRMVTRYDSTKTEVAWLADGYLKEIKQLEECIKNINNDVKFANVSDKVIVDLIINQEYKDTFEYLLSKDKKADISNELFIEILGCTLDELIRIEMDKQYMEYRLKEIYKNQDDSIISIGSIVELEDEYQDIEQYYIVKDRGGMEIIVDNKKVYCISKQTPIAKELLGRKKGENIIVTLGNKEKIKFTIKDIK